MNSGAKAVLDILLDLKGSCADIHILKANYEQELLEYTATGNVDSLRMLREMGIEATVESYGGRIHSLTGLGLFPMEHREFLQTRDQRYPPFKSAIQGCDLFKHQGIKL